MTGVVVSVGAGATIPLSAQHAAQQVPVVALVNHSATGDSLFLGQFCGGVPTSPQTVVTATHCVSGRNPETIDVVAGVADLCAPETGQGERRRVVSIEVLPRTGGTLSRLALASTLGATPAPPAVAPDLPPPGSRVAGWGWGRNAVSGTPSCILRKVDLAVVALDECRVVAEVTFAATDTPPTGSPPALCTVPLGDANTCTGDSGGPVTVERTDGSIALTVVAITLSGEGCGPTDRGLAVAGR